MVNEALEGMYQADLRDHALGLVHGTPEYLQMRERDRVRRQETAALIAENALEEGKDFFYAARIFQHGDTPEDALQAHQLALRAVEMGHLPARWLAAAAYDRWLMYQGKDQKFGTQYVSDGKRQRLWDVDPTTTDEERARWDVPPLKEQLRKAEEATRLYPVTPIGNDAPEWLKAAIRRWEDQ